MEHFMVKYIKILVSLCLLMFFASNAYSIMTYVGVEILDLKDDPAHSCAGETGYGSQGRIRAISSIVGHHPLYFNLSKTSDGSTVWSGDGTENVDYTIGDTIYLPTAVDLTVSETYNFFFDIDAIRIYVPMTSDGGVFTRTADNNYWTAGGVYSSAFDERGMSSQSGTCLPNSNYLLYPITMIYSNTRDRSLLDTCYTDGLTGNCVARGLYGVLAGNNDFKTDYQYDYLYQPDVGNVNIAFTYT